MALAVAVLAGAAAADAKSPATTLVCGASACRAADYDAITPVDSQPFTLRAAPRAAPFYTAVITGPAPAGFCWRLVFVPSRRVLRVENAGTYRAGDPVAGTYWRSVSQAYARRFTRAAAGLAPHAPAARWRGIRRACATGA